MTITRTWLDATLPAGEHLEDLAFMFSGSRHMEDQLEWLARMNDVDNMFPGWTKPGVEVSRYHDRWSVTMGGLCYKDKRGYLTIQEWYAGMTCWYVCIECGWREFIAAETPAIAV